MLAVSSTGPPADNEYTAYRNDAADRSDSFWLSILVPFYNQNPTGLLESLLDACGEHPGLVEIVMADDGSRDAGPVHSLLARMRTAGVPCSMLVLHGNRGRARVRNLLGAAARGDYILFLDGDMELTSPAYLGDYLRLIQGGRPAVAFGGIRMAAIGASDRIHRLHEYLSRRLHCLPAEQRNRAPGKYVYSSNLLLRRDLLVRHGFDEQFRGWGWEDVELGFRLSDRVNVVHVDNPVTHAGYHAAAELLERWGCSVNNFQILCDKHPDKVPALAIYKASATLARVPGIHALEAPLKFVVLSDARAVPLALRFWCWKFLRAIIYTDVFGPNAMRTGRRGLDVP